MRALAGADDDMGVALHALRAGQDLERRSVEGDGLGPGFRIRKMDAVAPDVLPFQGLYLGQARAGVEQQAERGHRRLCG